MWPDTETDVDYINYGETAELACTLVQRKDLLPISVGIFGSWGTGKSSILKLIEKRLGNDETEKYIVVKFDAWLYQGFDDARASLMEAITTSLVAEAQTSSRGLLALGKRLLKRVGWLRAAGYAAELGAAIAGMPMFGAAAKSVESIERARDGSATTDDAALVKSAIDGAVSSANQVIDKTTAQQEIIAFRSEFAELLSGLEKTLVVFVDNLDRCLPEQIIQTLEALRLFLSVGRSAFIVAADQEMVRHAVRQHFKDPNSRHITDYLDKLIQVPLQVPRVGIRDVRAYLLMLFLAAEAIPQGRLEALRLALEENLRQSWSQEQITQSAILTIIDKQEDQHIISLIHMTDRLAPILTHSQSVQGNPRIVKRLLNVVRLRNSVASARKMPIDEALVAKFAIFERCMSEAATTQLYRAISEAPEGKSMLIAAIEKATSIDDLRYACPSDWSDSMQLAFLANWLELPPSLTDRDLRALLYLSRETAPFHGAVKSLSASAAEALDALLSTRTSASPACKRALQAAPAAEHARIMEMILVRLRDVPEWKQQPQGLYGAILLANENPKTKSLLVEFLLGQPTKPQPKWLASLLADLVPKNG